MIEYFQTSMSSYLGAIGSHISISLAALSIAIIIAVPAGVLCVRYVRSKKIITTVFSILRVIPSLAVLLLLLPIMGTGVMPAVTALVILAVPPILMNTAAGLEDVPDFMLETAESCGMTDRQVWKNVRFPLASPMIFTGIKTAVIEVIASATLASKIGAGGMGDIIFTGLGLNSFELLFIGGITVAIISVTAGLLVDLLDRLLHKYRYF